jgi:hypothetical protein
LRAVDVSTTRRTLCSSILDNLVVDELAQVRRRLDARPKAGARPRTPRQRAAARGMILKLVKQFWPEATS